MHRSAQDRLLCRDKTYPARTKLIMSWKALNNASLFRTICALEPTLIMPKACDEYNPGLQYLALCSLHVHIRLTLQVLSLTCQVHRPTSQTSAKGTNLAYNLITPFTGPDMSKPTDVHLVRHLPQAAPLHASHLWLHVSDQTFHAQTLWRPTTSLEGQVSCSQLLYLLKLSQE